MLTPPNPIITKNIDPNNEKAAFKMDYAKQTIDSEEHRARTIKMQNEIAAEASESTSKVPINTSKGTDTVTLTEEYTK
jgi:hypothetical protein